jgi:general L-amino acid transport system substrate-binding protein
VTDQAHRRTLASLAALAGLLIACAPGEPAPPPAKPAPTAKPLEAKAGKSPTLDAIRARGRLKCGVHAGLAGFAHPDARQVWRGFDVDICRAVAAAVLGDAQAVDFVPLEATDRLQVLKDGRIDLLSRNTSWTFTRDAGQGFDFPAVVYYDGQGFLAPRALNLASADELSGARICVQAGTVSEQNLAEYFRERGLNYRPIVAPSEVVARTTYQEEGCDAFTADVSALASARSVMNNPGAHVILPTVISKEPLGPVVRQDDPVWTDVVRWTVFALILAEEQGLKQATVEAARKTATRADTRRLLGVEPGFGAMLGLSDDFAYQAIRQVGAYDEIFARNLTRNLRLQRGVNRPWSADPPGGLLYAPPLR